MWWEHAIEIAGIIVSAGVAIFTWRLASATVKLAEQTGETALETRRLVEVTEQEIRLTNEQNQRILWPVIGISISQTNDGELTLVVDATNCGNGAALDVSIRVPEVNGVPYIGLPQPLAIGSIGPGGSASGKAIIRNVGTRPRSGQIEVTYTTIFGTVGVSRWKWDRQPVMRVDYISTEWPSLRRPDEPMPQGHRHVDVIHSASMGP